MSRWLQFGCSPVLPFGIEEQKSRSGRFYPYDVEPWHWEYNPPWDDVVGRT